MLRNPLKGYVYLETFDLLDYSQDSEQDVKSYIQNQINDSKTLKSQIEQRRENISDFVNKITSRSENNFMYLYYILRDIERGDYKDLSLESFPKGLQGYYDFHWQRMGMSSNPVPDVKIKIVYILGESRQPVSRQQICDFSEEESKIVQNVLNEWEQFLHVLEKDERLLYSIYHNSFRDFLHRKDILEKSGITISGINQLIAKDLLQKWKNRHHV